MRSLSSDFILNRMMDLHPKVIDLTLDRVWSLLEALGNPQNNLPKVIHIAGTNGKGSTLSMLRAGLNEIGLKITAPNKTSTKADCITFLNEISKEEVLENLSIADALLFTSKYETLGLPLLEAIDYNIPIIAPYLDYSIEILSESCCYFYNYSIDSVVESILNMKLRKKEFSSSIIKQKKVIAGIITKYGVAHKKSLIPS